MKPGIKATPPCARVIARLDVSDPDVCWLWPGSTTTNGYGTVGIRENGKQRIAVVHRVIYEEFIGPIPDKYDVDHLCRVRLCCNPFHLEAVTRKENCRRGLKGVLCTECVHGHPYTEENTIYTKQGYKRCRICRDEHKARLYAKQAATRF